jgi:effector-binding domain-containing protein
MLPPREGQARSRRQTLPQGEAIAQVIRRFRDLGMSLDEIRAVLTAPDLAARNQRITDHLSRLETELGRTQSAVASLRDLLAAPSPRDPAARVQLRAEPGVEAVAIVDVVGAEESIPWLQGALAELRATLAAHNEPATGPAGGIYADEVFTEHRRDVTIFIPVAKPVQPTGRVTTTRIPAAELAVVEHRGPPDDVDRAYGTLATYVARHAIAVEGPIREYYLVGHHDTHEPTRWRTEIGWPIFQTGSG